MVALNIPPTLYHPIKRVTFLTPNNSCSFDYENPVNCILDVRGVYQFLAKRAIEAGVTIRLASSVESPIEENGYVTGIHVKNTFGDKETWKAPLTIDCSGFSSIVATRSVLHTAYRRYGFGAEWDLIAPYYSQGEV